MSRFLPLMAAAAVFTLPALAGTNFTAKLAQPQDSSERIIAAKALWDCNQDTCVAELNRRTVTVRTCKKVASEVGELAGFSNDKESLSAEDLAECNKSAKR
ncbi:CC_3452 family protein [Henriciella aquimarina]|uniref:CC_3452 family protein n=1 Tax=Henriciella aquimarina TaxID=545261 RepID=UPI00117AC97C|nr:hypothetical protein [Henriciella aquimarina]